MTLSSFSFLYFCLEQRPRLSNHSCICSLYLSCSVLSLLSENDDEVCIDAWAYLVGDGGFGVKSNFSKKSYLLLGTPFSFYHHLACWDHWWPHATESSGDLSVYILLTTQQYLTPLMPASRANTPGRHALLDCLLCLWLRLLTLCSIFFFFSSLLLNIKVSQGLLLGLLFFLFLLYILSQESHWWAWLPLPPHQGWLPVHSLV